jgi:hypothetical protein
MDKGRHPNVIRTWLAGKIQNQVLRDRNNLTTTHRKFQPHNKN